MGGEEEVQALVLSGDAGLGKTTLWTGALEQARASGIELLVALRICDESASRGG